MYTPFPSISMTFQRFAAVCALVSSLSLASAAHAVAIVDVACMKKAIEDHDGFAITAYDAFDRSMHDARVKRKNDMVASWDVSTQPGRKAAVKAANQAFKNSEKGAKNAVKAAISSADKQYKTDVKNCTH